LCDCRQVAAAFESKVWATAVYSPYTHIYSAYLRRPRTATHSYIYIIYIYSICISSYSRVSGVDMKFKLRPIVGLHTHFPSAHFNIKTQTWLLLSARYFFPSDFCMCATKCLRLTWIVKIGGEMGKSSVHKRSQRLWLLLSLWLWFQKGRMYTFICWYNYDWKIFELPIHL